MKTVTVSKLKASLSEYLREVKAGEEVLVTERGQCSRTQGRTLSERSRAMPDEMSKVTAPTTMRND